MHNDVIEYYDGDTLIARVSSTMVPPVDSAISIRGKPWMVVSVTYALDYADGLSSDRSMRANVNLKKLHRA